MLFQVTRVRAPPYTPRYVYMVARQRLGLQELRRPEFSDSSGTLGTTRRRHHAHQVIDYQRPENKSREGQDDHRRKNQRILAAVTLTIAALEDDMATDAASRQPGSFTANVIDAIHDLLRDEGPMHRGDILTRLEDKGSAKPTGAAKRRLYALAAV